MDIPRQTIKDVYGQQVCESLFVGRHHIDRPLDVWGFDMLEHEQQAKHSLFRGVISSVGSSFLVVLFVLIIDLISILVLEWPGTVGPVWLFGYLIIPSFAASIFGYRWSHGQRQIGAIGGAISGVVSIIFYNAMYLATGALQILFRRQFDYTWGFFLEYAVLSLVWLLPLALLLGAGAGWFFSRFSGHSSDVVLNEVASSPKSVAKRIPIPGAARIPRASTTLLILGVVIMFVGIWSSNAGISVLGLLLCSVSLIRISPNLLHLGNDSRNLRLSQAFIIDRKRVKTIDFTPSGSLSLIIVDLILYGIKRIKTAIRPSYQYSIEIEFCILPHGDLDGTMRLEASVTKKLYEWSLIGTPISILYDESNPTKVILEGESKYARFRSGAIV